MPSSSSPSSLLRSRTSAATSARSSGGKQSPTHLAEPLGRAAADNSGWRCSERQWGRGYGRWRVRAQVTVAGGSVGVRGGCCCEQDERGWGTRHEYFGPKHFINKSNGQIMAYLQGLPIFPNTKFYWQLPKTHLVSQENKPLHLLFKSNYWKGREKTFL